MRGWTSSCICGCGALAGQVCAAAWHKDRTRPAQDWNNWLLEFGQPGNKLNFSFVCNGSRPPSPFIHSWDVFHGRTIFGGKMSRARINPTLYDVGVGGRHA